MENNINELIYLYHLRDPEALALLIEAYHPLTASLQSLTPPDMEPEDYRQVADSVLVECLNSWRQDLNLSFSTYYKSVLVNRIRTLGRKWARKQPDPGATFVSLDDVLPDGDRSVHEAIEDPRVNVARQVQARYQLDALYRSVCKDRGAQAARVLSMRSMEYTLKEICERTGLSIGRVRYILRDAERQKPDPGCM
ncbi:RNA polymerase sigma factor [Faecalibaculum rodentium]|jgi:RNA polymerase sigma factor (sigma-70 family)|uniref:RNA polymerase sigma factor n=1 Tax=Faecalibaculum rodentium TaxID=1702221 RepID=UPI0023F462C9|nr:hypothetical protein [Faecalibaculum rodentium]